MWCFRLKERVRRGIVFGWPKMETLPVRIHPAGWKWVMERVPLRRGDPIHVQRANFDWSGNGVLLRLTPRRDNVALLHVQVPGATGIKTSSKAAILSSNKEREAIVVMQPGSFIQVERSAFNMPKGPVLPALRVCWDGSVMREESRARVLLTPVALALQA